MLSDVRLVASVIRQNGGRFVALTGAGCSTESGIPDYRSPGTGLYSRRPNFQPLTIQKFLKNDFEQKRYWGRSIFGYRGLSHKDCNKSHLGLHKLCNTGTVPLLITQNVDGLHHLARHGGRWRGVSEELFRSPEGVVVGAESCDEFGSAVDNGELCELHGNIHLVKCMKCGHLASREDTQKTLVELNGELFSFVEMEKAKMRPDADYELDDEIVDRVKLHTCERCGEGRIRPDVVLFGENVPESRVQQCYRHIDACPVVVCFGTSLHVYSSFRFVKRVDDMRKGKIASSSGLTQFSGEPTVIIVNRGPTRGDDLATIKVETESVGEFVDCLERELTTY